MKGIIFFLLIGVGLATFSQQHVIVLGVAQDGGFPHIGCQRECLKAHSDPSLAKYVVSLALVDPETKQWWLFEATPDMDKQLQYFQELTKNEYDYLPNGIFLTHAHIGHYTGLMYLGKEALGAQGVKIHVFPRMGQFLQSNGPWSQLIHQENIKLQWLEERDAIRLTENIRIEPFTVPHRDEFSETAGFKINTKKASYLFIPDIDKWDKWSQNIVAKVKDVDHAFLDATFFRDGELPNRAMHEVPHPFVSETMQLFEKEDLSVKNKVVFIHMNHTNPLLFDSNAREEVRKEGYRIANQGSVYE